MPNYNKPPFNNIPFRFTTGGYEKPPFEQVPFRWGLRPSYEQTADLQAAINVISQDSADLSASITGEEVGGYRDLSAYIKSTIEDYKNLGAAIRRLDSGLKDLVAYTKATTEGYKDLGAAIRRLNKESTDLLASIGTHLPADLAAELNVIEIRNLIATINGVLFSSSADLASRVGVFQHVYVDLNAYIASGLLLGDLAVTINIISISNLPAVLKAINQEYLDLNAYLKAREIKNLGASLHGWDERFLSASLVGEYGPYDIQAYLNPVPSQNLLAYITGWKGYQISFDLSAFVRGDTISDLGASIYASGAKVDLSAYIFAGGGTNLGATIIPKTIRMKRALQISLLEHKDLKAIINFQCFGSGYSDLAASLHVLYKLDLKAYIIGWYGGTSDNLKELGAHINTETYTVQNTYLPKFVPAVDKYTQLKIWFSGTGPTHIAFDTIDILYGSYYSGNLTATITGILTSMDLGASLTPVQQANYTELPDYISPKTHEVVIDFTAKWRERWRVFVELMFAKDGAEPYHYFYVSGSSMVYKIDRSRHWTIWADSYQETDDEMVERRNVRTKYIFRMSDYATVDAAVRDLIDRVSAYRRADLGALISGSLPPHLDLTASIEPEVKYSWVKHLSASITGV